VYNTWHDRDNLIVPGGISSDNDVSNSYKEQSMGKVVTRIVIVGGVAGGASAAARLRRMDEFADIVLFERGGYISFANCGLPYFIGGEIADRDALTLQTPESFHARFRVDVRTQQDVTAIDPVAKTVTVVHRAAGLACGKTYVEPYDKLILSPGAAPIVPDIPGVASACSRVFTLRNIPDTHRIKDFIDTTRPQTAVVAGGGYIGVEMAENLRQAGLAVTVVERMDQVIAPLDYDMACDVHTHLRRKGVTLRLSTAVRTVEDTAAGLRVTLGGESQPDSELLTDMLILSVGVRPENALAKSAGLAMGERGGIKVDPHMRTSNEHIYAVGDAVEVVDFVTGQPAMIPLAGPANKQGRIAADHICGRPAAYTGTQGSAILRVFDLTVATTGLNEKTAKRLGLAYDKTFTYSNSHAGYFPGAVPMCIKTLFEQGSGKILGAQIVGGDGVDKRCDVLATAIRASMTAADLARLELCYAPPYSSAKDPVNMAGFVADNLLTGLVKHIHWHDVSSLPRDGSVTLLDVRTTVEYDNGHIDGFVNIPLDELRERLAELDNRKPLYVNCRSGQRSYLAARILSQRGFDVYNLDGGYRLYHTVTRDATAPSRDADVSPAPAPASGQVVHETKTIRLDARGLQCPGPIMKLAAALKDAHHGDIVEIHTTDPAFAGDLDGYCRRTGQVFLGGTDEKGVTVARIQKSHQPTAEATRCAATSHAAPRAAGTGKNFILFSGDLDKAIATFIMANAAAAMGRKVSIFFTFWGLNVLRKPKPPKVTKDFISRMFGWMMPRGSRKLGLSSMNMGGLGAKLIRAIMKKKNVDSLETLIAAARQNGVELIACTMSMDIMGLKAEELLDGIKPAGATAMLAHAEESDMSLFI